VINKLNKTIHIHTISILPCCTFGAFSAVEGAGGKKLFYLSVLPATSTSIQYCEHTKVSVETSQLSLALQSFYFF